MSNINISGKEPIDDPEYRYKMPRLIGKVEGRGNGIKTAIVNIREVSGALHRSPEEVTKFFGFELGAQTIWVDATDKSIVNGAHTDMVLQQLVHKYVDLFVLCPNCRLPESQYKIKNGVIYHNCMACGDRQSLDMSHKLTTFIVNKHKKEKKEKDKLKDKKDRKSSKDKIIDEGVKEKKVKKDKKEKKEKKEKKAKNSDGSKSDDELSRVSRVVSEDAALSASKSDDEFDAIATADNLEVDDAGAFDNCVMSIHRYICDNVSPEQLVEELRTAQTFSAFPIHYRVHLLIAAVFKDKTAVTETDISACIPVLKLLENDINDQRHIIGAFELLCVVRNAALKPYFPVILKLLYDADLVEEETVISWANRGFSDEFTPPGVLFEDVQDLVALAQPFITWLEEAEEDGSDEDD